MNKNEKAKIVAEIICNKNFKYPFEECFKSNNKVNLCNNSQQCRIKEKSEEQLDYILSNLKENIYLEACPGSGKTEVLSLKAAYEINKWDEQGGMAFLTFTNEAAHVIEQRVKECTRQQNIFPHFIGTLHSFIYGYISQPYGYKIMEYDNKSDKSIKLVDEKDRNEWLTSFKVNNPKVLNIPIYPNQIDINPINEEITIREREHVYTIEEYYNRADIQSKIKKAREKQGSWYFSKRYFIDICIQAKKKFFKSGFATFNDMLYIAYKILKNNEAIAQKIAKRYKVIFIDECQDLSHIEISILNILNQNGVIIHLIGDLSQAIYEYKNATPEIIKDYVENNSFKLMYLNRCFRCSQKIVDVFQKIVGKQNIIGNISDQRKDDCIFVDYSNVNYNELINWYNRYCNERLGTESTRIALVRGTGLKNKILNGNVNKMELPDIFYYWKNKNFILKKKALESFGMQICKQMKESYRNNSFYCPNTIKDIARWKLFLTNTLNKGSDFSESNIKYSMWYKKVRETLRPLIIENYKKYLLDYDEGNHLKQIEEITFKAPANRGNEKVKILEMLNNQNNNVKTVHSVKGQTFESIMLVSNENNGQGTNWKEWLQDQNSEYARIAYVASSRPKNLLVWAVSNITREDVKKLEGLGLKMEIIE